MLEVAVAIIADSELQRSSRADVLHAVWIGLPMDWPPMNNGFCAGEFDSYLSAAANVIKLSNSAIVWIYPGVHADIDTISGEAILMDQAAVLGGADARTRLIEVE